MHRQLAAFVEQPCKETFLAARDAVLGESLLPLVASEIAELDRLLADRQLETLLDRLDALPPSKVLSPRIHFLAAEAADALGRASDVELERSLFVLTLQGLLATGDGTRDNPYVVTHPTDEYDVLAALGLRSSGQSLTERNGRLYDIQLCDNARQLWFDVTDLLVPRRRAQHAAKQRARRVRRRLRISRAHR